MVKGIEALSRDDAMSTSDSDHEKHGKQTVDIPTEIKTSIVLSGPEMITLNEYQWEQLCKYDEIVFARTTPEQKLRIVREFQGRDEIVGMTGDGVNDAPSLKAADIGIALGSGSDIAIEAADMVLLESFSAVVEAVQYGRVVFDNLKKTIAYLLPAGSFSEFWPVMTSVIFGLPQVLSSFLMIIICCFTDCAAATVLAYEAPEADVLLRKPRKPKTDRLVDWQLMLQSYGLIGILETTSSFAMSYWYLQRSGIPFSDLWFRYGSLPDSIDQDYANARLNEASSIYFINLVVMQFFTLMTIRTRRLSIFQHPPAFNKMTQNLYLFPAIAFALCMAIFWLYIPQLQSTLNTSRVPVEHFFLPAAFGLGILFLDEARKFCVRKWPKRFLARIAW
jgi:sodium/potassium-transporting ATPase subunit alpha